MRYEDLKLNPRAVLEQMFCFILDVQSIEGTVVQRRIAEVTQTGFANSAAYKLKSTSSSICRQRHMYTDAQIEMMERELAEMIKFWRYGQSEGESSDNSDLVQANFFNV